LGGEGEGQIKISGPISMRMVHGFRAASDAILVGIGTALADDPQLTCRLPGLYARSPVRVVVDRQARLPLNVQACPDLRGRAGLAGLRQRQRMPIKVNALAAAGVNIIRVPATQTGIDPDVILSALATRGITRLMVEGGARLASSFLNAGLIDDLCVVTGDMEIGEGGIPALHDLDLANVLTDPQFARIGAGYLGADRYTYLRKSGA
jgi:diaminohydroxyphosphoribosylaminopyrimidine deaminase/5-amino-6-(5-phosphoribosylamino)uracil reductase